MRNRRRTILRLLLFAGIFFVIGQFGRPFVKQLLKDWICGPEKTHQGNGRIVVPREVEGNGESVNRNRVQVNDNGIRQEAEPVILKKPLPTRRPERGEAEGNNDTVNGDLKIRQDSEAKLVKLKKPPTTRRTEPRQAEGNDKVVNGDRVQVNDNKIRPEGEVLKKPTSTRRPMNSFLSPYHKQWDVNCSQILAGNRTLVKQTNMMLKKLRDENDNLLMPSDTEVEGWMEDCREFRRNRNYPQTPISHKEEEYPLAYIILTHKEVVQVERLLRSIYQPQNVYCIHPDIKSPPSYQSAIRKLASCFDNVFIASKIESIQYAGYTRLQADINCMTDLLKHPVKWKYVMNLCGQDFPLKTNLEIVRQLKAYNSHNDINGIIPPPYIAPRTKFHHKMDGKKPQRTRKKKTPPPYNLTIYFGNAYYAAMREFVDFVINDKIARDFLNWSNDTWSPDEHYWVTLQRSPYAPGGYPNATWDENIRFMKWGDVKRHPGCQGKYVRALCVFGVGYLEYLHKQPYLFANKFYYSFDPIAIQCIEEMLDYRTLHPEASDRLDNFPVKDLVWQNYVPPKSDGKSKR